MKHFAFAIIVLLGLTISCASTAIPQPQTTHVSATAEIPTVIPASTPTNTSRLPPSPTLTVSFTPTPTDISVKIVSGEWGNITEGVNAGKVDPIQMYSLVGAVNRANRSVLPIGEVGKTKVAVDTTGADLSILDKSTYDKLKADHLNILNADQKFRTLWLQLTIAMQNAGLASDKTTVIWDPATKKVKMVIVQNSDDIKRYSVLEKQGGLALEEARVKLLPWLKVNGPYIERTDLLSGDENQRRIQFKGAGIYTFNYNGPGAFTNAKDNIDIVIEFRISNATGSLPGQV